MTRTAVIAQTRTELALAMRRGESLLVTIAIPLGILIFFARVDSLSGSVSEPVEFLVPGVLSLAVMATAMVSLGINTGYERHYGVLKRLGVTPLSRTGLLSAKTLQVLVIEFVQSLLLVLTGWALGWQLTPRIIPALVVLLVGTVAFAGIGLLLAGTLRAEVNLAVSNGLFLVLLFLGGMAYPLDRLPGALEMIAHVLPSAALAETVRGVLDPAVAFPYADAVVLLMWAVAAPVMAVRWFRWEE